jgi:hypothetical protein
VESKKERSLVNNGILVYKSSIIRNWILRGID